MQQRKSRLPGRGALVAAVALLTLALGAPAALASDGALRLGPQDPQAKKPAIVGGTAISVTQTPWQIFMQADGSGGMSYACGGSIIDATHVVTAGHCVFDGTTATQVDASRITVVAGISNFRAPDRTAQPRRVASIRVHPGYSFTLENRGVAPDDVAVLELTTPQDLTGPAAQPNPQTGAGAYPCWRK